MSNYSINGEVLQNARCYGHYCYYDFNSSYLLTPKFTYTIVILECHKNPLYIYMVLLLFLCKGPRDLTRLLLLFKLAFCLLKFILTAGLGGGRALIFLKWRKRGSRAILHTPHHNTVLEQETQALASEHDDSMCLLKRQISLAWDFKQGLFGENFGPVLTFALF